MYITSFITMSIVILLLYELCCLVGKNLVDYAGMNQTHFEDSNINLDVHPQCKGKTMMMMMMMMQ